LQVARLLTGGLFEPPPAMLASIIEWGRSKDAVNDIALYQRVLADGEENIEYYQEQMEKKPERDEFYQNMIDQSVKQREHYETMIEEKKREITFPRVRLKEWKRATRKFKVNLRGWKYLPKLKKAPYFKNTLKMYEDGIKVTLVRGKIKSKGDAYWKSIGAMMVVKMGAGWEQMVKHELTHFAQDFIQFANATGGKALPTSGRPSQKIQTPEVKQHIKKLTPELKEKGVKPTDIHDLDDVEFYTELQDAVDAFKKNVDLGHYQNTKDDALSFIKDRHYFNTLFRGSRPKWRKAIKEFMKAVL